MDRPQCLIIDDSRLARRICRGLVEGLGYDVSEAEQGAIGLSMCASTSFDLILVDVNMPVLGGIDFVMQLRATKGLEHVPVILCSSDANPALIRRALHFGANAYLNKPFDARALERRLNRLQKAA